MQRLRHEYKMLVLYDTENTHLNKTWPLITLMLLQQDSFLTEQNTTFTSKVAMQDNFTTILHDVLVPL